MNKEIYCLLWLCYFYLDVKMPTLGYAEITESASGAFELQEFVIEFLLTVLSVLLTVKTRVKTVSLFCYCVLLGWQLCN